jgi:tetratricopeptide (TPR) repeat protein
VRRAAAMIRSSAMMIRSDWLLGLSSGLAILVLAASCLLASIAAREREPPVARVEIHTGRKGCAAELDSASAGETDLNGNLVLAAVEPGDHYVHIGCAGERGKSYFISPHVGEKVEVHHGIEGVPAAEAAASLEPAEIKVRLRQHIQEAVHLRTRGHIEEAVAHLRNAFQLDPENSDLHREMGITFLLAKEWKRARVEMLEAVRYDPTDADAHNGLGYALEKLGSLKAALKEYRTAARLQPDDPTYLRHYLDTLARLSAKQAEQKQ